MNYESGVIAEKGEPITVGIEDEPLEFEDSQRSSKRRLMIIGGLVVLALAIAAYFVMRGGGTTTPAGDENAQAPTVTVVTPGQTTVDGEITATGTFSARREMPVGVVGEGGRVVSVPVDAGDAVKAAGESNHEKRRHDHHRHDDRGHSDQPQHRSTDKC